MLHSLEIRDLLIIDQLTMEFRAGLNVLTGETGAGKSILLDALGFVLGWRGRAELVRAGAEQGEVTAVFDLPTGHRAHAVLSEAGLPDGDELILRRVNTIDGRKTAWVNDRRASGEVLRALSDTLVELHGQQDDRGLLDPRSHRALLDDFASHDPLRAEVAGNWTAWRRAERAVRDAEAALEAVRAEEDYLRHAVDELDKLAPEPGEDAQLDAERRRMQGAERIRDDILRAAQLLGHDGAESAMGEAARWLDGVAPRADGQLDPAIAALERAMVELGEATDSVARCLDDMSFDPGALDATEERLFAIRAVARKHEVAPDDLGAFAEDLRGRLAGLEAGDADLVGLRAAARDAAATFAASAARLTESRIAAASGLDRAMARELAPLKLDRAVFATQVTSAPAGPDGQDAVAFTVATNPGAPAGPIGKIASGGELSRFLLALKVCLSQSRDDVQTMIFDEIDRGVGGATADAVGRRLSELAARGQVLVVTHSPQVAALGAHHWRVEKTVTDGTTLSTVVALSAEAREAEIARMLAGDIVTDAARAAARALLAG